MTSAAINFPGPGIPTGSCAGKTLDVRSGKAMPAYEVTEGGSLAPALVSAPFHLDSMLTFEQCADWLQMTERELGVKSREPRPEIPAMRWGAKTVRFHPRTIIATAAARAGVRPEIIAAMFGLNQKPTP